MNRMNRGWRICPVWGFLALLTACSGDPDRFESARSAAYSRSDGGGSRDGGGSFDGGSSDGGAAAFVNPLPIPAVLQPTSTDATSDNYDITIKAAQQQILPGNKTTIWGFNGVWPGPTIVATKGRQVRVTQTNNLTENITIHNHGHNAPPTSDGHPTDYVAPGASKTYVYPNNQRASTYWYHDHTLDLTGKHIYYGLAGFYIIHDPAEDSLNLPSGTYDVPVVIQDRTFNSDNSLSYTVDSSAIRQGFLGNTLTVNGAVTPFFNVATHKYRIRFLNGSNSRSYKLSLSDGSSMQVIASDTGLLAGPVPVSSLTITPAERYDVVIDFTKYSVGATVVLNNDDHGFPSLPQIMQFRVTSSVSDTSAVPATLSTITKLNASQAVLTRTLTFSQRNGDWTINGLTYDPARIDYTPALGTIEKWVLQNDSGEMHPFHEHLSPHQILDIDGSPPPPEMAGWKDTVAVPSRKTVDILIQWTGFAGVYVFHCHKLEHEDHAMMLQVQTH